MEPRLSGAWSGLLAGFSSRRPGFNPRTVEVEFVEYEVTLRRGFPYAAAPGHSERMRAEFTGRPEP